MVPKKIAISVGEPAGIGPDILIQTVQKRRKDLLIDIKQLDHDNNDLYDDYLDRMP